MKKFLALVCAGVMSMSLFACTTTPEATPTPAPTVAQTTDAPATPEPATVAPPTAVPDVEPQGADLNVAVFYYTFSDTYIATVRSELDRVLNSAGIQFLNYDSNNNQTTQNEQIDTALSQGANLLVVNVVTSGATDVAQEILSKADAQGVPVIFFNRAIGVDNDEAPLFDSYANSVFVGTDAPEAGHMQGQMIGGFLLANYDNYDLNGDGVISYAMFKGDEANVEAIARTQYGVEDANAVLTAAGAPALEYFDSSNSDGYQVDLNGSWSAQAANEYMVTNLTQYNESSNNMIELVICNNDGMAEGAISALNDAGYNLGDGASTTIPVFGVDATDAAKELIADGKMAGTIKQDNVGMAEGIGYFVTNLQAGANLKDGIGTFNQDPECPSKVYIPYAIYTGE